MRLRGVVVECVDSNVEFAYEVKKKTMHITTFIDMECFKRLKLSSDDFHTIVIGFVQKPPQEVRIGNNGLIVDVSFDKEKYLSIRSDVAKLHEYLYSLIEQGVAKAHEKYPVVPKQEVFQTMSDFRELNYAHTWSHKKRRDRVRKLSAELICSLELDSFSLRLVVKQANNEVFNREILRTEPDPFAYHYRFKDVLIDEKKIIVTSKTSKVNLLKYDIAKNRATIYDNE